MKSREIHKSYRNVTSLKKSVVRLLKDPSLAPAFKITLFQLAKDIESARSFWGNLRKRNGKGKARICAEKLQIGGGRHYLKDFVNLDFFPPADVIRDCRYGLPFRKESFKFVFSEHFFEHIDFPISAKKVLREIYRVLEPGGSVLLGVPDGGRVVRAYYKKEKRFLNKLRDRCYSNRRPPVEIYGDLDLVNYIFRDQLDNPRYTMHYWAYDEMSLGGLLKSVGFRRVKKSSFDKRYCNPKRKFYTLYMEAIK